MNVLLVNSSIKDSWPYLPELITALEQSGVVVDVLDLATLSIRSGKITVSSYPLLAKLNRTRFLNRLTRKMSFRLAAGKIKQHYDCINIHFSENIYIRLLPAFKRWSDNVAITIWGSDFYRATEEDQKLRTPLYNGVDRISFNNPYTQEDFKKRFPQFGEKLLFTGFGIGMFDVIRKVQRATTKTALLQAFNWPADKIIVTIGYNARREQQHELLIDQIVSLPSSVTAQLFLVFPVSYGRNEEYIDGLKAKMKQIDIPCAFLDDFMDEESVARLRLTTDIVLNAQVTDSFSGSLQEHLLCNNILIAGDWLPYQTLSNINVHYIPSPKHTFGQHLAAVINNMEEAKSACAENSEKMYNQSNWNNRIGNWLEMYQGK